MQPTSSNIRVATGQHAETVKVSAEEMLRSVRLNPSALWYAGVAANESDLGADKLEKLYQQVLTNVSPEAAADFVRLVQGTKSLAPSAFIEEFLIFASHNWRYEPTGYNLGICPVDPRQSNETNEAVMLTALATAGFFPGINGSTDQTERIRTCFLSRHSMREREIRQVYSD